MSDADLIARYNYDEFAPHNIVQWMNFDASPLFGQVAPDFTLWDLDGQETRLSDIWSANTYSVVEFGSFT